MWSENSITFAPNVCRLCASVSEVVIPVFGKDGEKERIDLKIKKCLPIIVREEDVKPKQVCFTCVSKLDICVDLVELCLAAEFKFESILQSRVSSLKGTATETSIQSDIETPKNGNVADSSMGVISLLGNRAPRSWPEEVNKADHSATNTLTVQHDGGVIVLSKVDTEDGGHPREDCQDILLMVELKYKDMNESQHGTIAKASPVTYTVEPHDAISKALASSFVSEAGKSPTVTYTNEMPSVINQKSQNITYTIDPQAVSSTKTYTFAYAADTQPSIGGKSNSITYTAAAPTVSISKIQALYGAENQSAESLNKSQVTFTNEPHSSSDEKGAALLYAEAEAYPVALTKASNMDYAGDLQRVMLTKSQILTFSAGESSVLANKSNLLSYATDEEANNGTKTQLLAYASDPSLEPQGSEKAPLEFSPDLQVRPAVSKEKVPGSIAETRNTSLTFSEQAAPLGLDSNISAHTSIIINTDKYKLPAGEENISPPRSEKRFHCDMCGKSFMRRTNLNAHMGVHTQVRPHTCDQCGKAFVLRWDLTLHQRIHAGLYSCEFCNKAFSVRGKLERHRRTHTGERPYPCTTCGKAFGDKRNLESHQRTHSGERPFTCATCGRSFRVRSHLSDHRRVHSQEAPFTCDICGKSFKWKTNLNIHLKIHAGERFPCAECGREFARRADLAKHRRSHSGDRPHACGVCGKSYSDKSMLQKHLKSHSDHKPFSCDICGKSFLFHWYLATHKKTHLEEGSFCCVHCGKVFNKRGNFLSHAKCHSVNLDANQKAESSLLDTRVMPQVAGELETNI